MVSKTQSSVLNSRTCVIEVCINYIYIYLPRKSKTKQRMVFRMIHGINHPGDVKNISEKSCQEMVGFGLYDYIYAGLFPTVVVLKTFEAIFFMEMEYT